MSSTLDDVVASVFTPGTNKGLVRAMTYSFYALFVTLLGMLWLTGGNLHVVALLTLAVGLFISIKWFLVQIASVEAIHRTERLAKEAEEKAAGGAAAGEVVAAEGEKPKAQ